MLSSKDSWLSDYDSMVQLGARIGAKIRDRDEQERGSLQRNKLDSSVGQMITSYQKKLQILKASLHKLSTSRKISDLEYERRKGMIEELSEKYQQLEKAKSRGWAPRYNAMDSVDSWGEGVGRDGPGMAHRMSADEIRTQQQVIIAEQDRGLDQLSHALRRQRDIGLAIQGEVEEQNLLIDDIREGTQRADIKVQTQTRRVSEFRRKDSCKCTCALWTTIIILFIAILIVIFVKYDNKPNY